MEILNNHGIQIRGYTVKPKAIVDCFSTKNFSTITGFSTISTVHLVEKVILIIQVLSTILQVSTSLQSTIAGFYCNLGLKKCQDSRFRSALTSEN